MLAERHIQVALCAFCSMLNYADRVNISVTIIAMAEQYSWSVKQQASIMSAFFAGYLPMQIGGALLCRRFGAKSVLLYGAFLWSLFTAITPYAAHVGLRPLLVCRVGMGLSEGVAFPSVYHYLASWIPAAERGRAVSSFIVGVHVGTTVALVLSPRIIAWHSWQMVFYIFGGAGIIWILFWIRLAEDKDVISGEPTHTKRGKPSYRMLQQNEGSSPASLSPTHSATQGSVRSTTSTTNETASHASVRKDYPSGSILSLVSKRTLADRLATVMSPSEMRALVFIATSKPCLAVCCGQFTMSFCHYCIISWLPTYFNQVFQVKTTSLSFTCLPYIAMAICANFGGWGADYLVSRGFPLTLVRKFINSVAFCGGGSFLIAFSMAPSVFSSVVLITIALSLTSVVTGGFESSFLDIAAPSLAGFLKSVANTLGAFSGMLAMPYTTAVLALTGDSWRVVFGSLGLYYMIGAAVFAALSTSERLLVEEGPVAEDGGAA